MSANTGSAPKWVSILFPDGKPIVYGLALADKRYATQWTVYRGPVEDGLHEIEFFLELDPVAAGFGGGLVKQCSLLTCDAELAPLTYTSEAAGARWEVHFEPARVSVTLPEGSVRTVPRDGAQFLSADNVPAHKALIYAHLAAGGPLRDEETVQLFLANRLATVPYQITAAPEIAADSGAWYRTSYLEEIRLTDRGLLIEGIVPAQGIRGWLDDSNPPLPEWRTDKSPVKASLRYQPAANAPFSLSDVTIPGPVTPIGATLSIPPGPGPFPAVLFLSGSGTHDRHGIAGEIDAGTHEIMDFLAERGLLGLRYDSRGAGTTKLGDEPLDRGIDSDLADARATLEFLRNRPEAAGRPLFLIGHSQGGTEALVLAAENRSSVRGVVLMAAMGRGIAEVIENQIVSMGNAVGLNAGQIEQQLQEFREAVRLVQSGTAWDVSQIPHHILAMFPSPSWLKQFLSYNPTELVVQLHCPLLICQGGKDFQVSPERDAERLVAAAREAGIDCTYAFFPDLDHLFKTTPGTSTLAQYYDQARRVDREFLARLANWLTGRTTCL